MTLTAKAIAAALPGSTLRDDQVHGLHVRIFEGRRSFYLYYRTRHGEERKPKLGDYPTLTVNDARRIARDMLVEVAGGADPSAKRQADRAGMTVGDLIDNYNAAVLPKRKAKRNKATIFEKHIRPALGSRKAAALQLYDVADLHTRLSAAGKPTQANRVLAGVSVLLNLAERLQARPLGSNFCKLIERNAETKRKRYLRPGDEARALGEALHRRLYGPQHEAVLFIYLLILTGARLMEIGDATLAERRGNQLVLGADRHKTGDTSGEKTIFLPEIATMLLDDPERPPHHRVAHLVGVANPQKLWRAVKREAGCADLRIHDLRHTFASFGVGAGVSLSLVGGLLGHSSTQTTKRYEHLLAAPAEAAVNTVAGAVAGALQLEKAQ